MTLAVGSALCVNADVWTLQGLLGALVHVLTRLPVRAEKHSFRAEAENLKIRQGLIIPDKARLYSVLTGTISKTLRFEYVCLRFKSRTHTGKTG